MTNGNIKQAIEHFQNVIDENHPDNNNDIAVSAKKLGEAQLQKKNYKEAVKYLNKAINKVGGYSDAYTLRGVSHYYLNDTISCRKDMDKAIILNPKDITAKNFLKILNK